MGTQAVVSLTDNYGRTLFKVVAGVNGANASAFAAKLRGLYHWPTIRHVYNLAAACELGSPSCLVVMTPRSCLYNPEEPEQQEGGEDELSPRYREKFPLPLVNPRWECGLADHSLMVRLRDTLIDSIPADWFPPPTEGSVNVNKQEDGA